MAGFMQVQAPHAVRPAQAGWPRSGRFRVFAGVVSMIPIVSTVPTAGNGFVPVVESARGAVDVAQVSLFSVDAVMHGQCRAAAVSDAGDGAARSEEHTSELQSLMRISYAVFGLKKKKKQLYH